VRDAALHCALEQSAEAGDDGGYESVFTGVCVRECDLEKRLCSPVWQFISPASAEREKEPEGA
jgi:hypothetical protein